MNICVIGRSEILLETINELIKNKFKIDLIITSKKSDHEKIGTSDFKKIAKKINSDFIESNNINSSKIQNLLKRKKFDLGISINNPILINSKTLSLFRHGILNAHAGDLPKYRGNACPNWAILNNEKQIALTIHFMDEKLDSGDIVKKIYFPINKNTSITDFYEFALKKTPKLFLDVVNSIKNGKIKRKKQSTNPKNSLRTYPRNKFDGKISWNDSAENIEKLIRASGSPFFGSYTYFNTEKLFLVKASVEIPKFKYLSQPGQIVERRKNGEIVVSCGNNFLVISKLKFKNKIYDKPSELITTIYTRLGMDVENEIERILKSLNK